MKHFMILSILFLTGIFSSFQEKSKTILNEKNNGDTLSLTKGKTFQVVFTYNQGTGYEWELSKKDPFYSYEKKVELPTHQMPGAPVNVVYTVKILKSGFKRISWYFKRSWEKENLKTFKVYINTP